MHNLALALHDKGIGITGSDDIIYDPARSRLEAEGLLTDKIGWHPERITEDLDLVILGMHAKKDNPELRKAQDLGLDIQSFPEFIGKNSPARDRIVICGSHGKTTTTSMIMHVLRSMGRDMDYLVGSQLDGFNRMVRVSGADTLVVEGDEYLSSALDPRPKFLHYDPTICLITGLDWDHINVFPTEAAYLEAFIQLVKGLKKDAVLVYNHEDPKVVSFIQEHSPGCRVIPYKHVDRQWADDHWEVAIDGVSYSWHVPGEHNVNNLMGALAILEVYGIAPDEAMSALSSFALPAQRLNVLYESDERIIFRDFAHAPSKVCASVGSMAMVKGEKALIAVLEIHTYSSLNKAYLPQYNGALDLADHAFLYFNPKNLEIKRMAPLEPDFLKMAFGRHDLSVHTDAEDLSRSVKEAIGSGPGLFLLMSSSNFGGVDWLDVLT